MSRFFIPGKVLSAVAQGSTSSVVSPPILLQPRRMALPTSPASGVKNQNSIIVPGSGATMDLQALTATTIVTGQAGTTPTLTTTIEGTNSFTDQNTTLTATLSAAATSISLTARDGIAQFDWVLLMAADGSYSEWVQVTSAAATGAGVHTIVRSQFGTTAQAFNTGDFLFFTRSWVAVPTANATTTTMTSGATSITAATLTAPVISVVDSQALGMTKIPYPIIRVKTTVGGSSTPTATYQVNVNGLIQATDNVRGR